MFRIIQEGHPDWVVAENVAGITSMAFPGEVSTMGGQADIFGETNEIHELRQEYILNHIIDDLESEGYEVQPFVIPACAVGAPHRRDRIWIVANRNQSGLQAEGAEQQAARIKQYGELGGNVADPDNHGSHGTENRQSDSQGNDGSQTGKKPVEQFEGRGGKAAVFASNSIDTGLQGDEQSGEYQEENCQRRESPHGAATQFCRGSNWSDWPTQPPVCSGDDGISERLDGITFSKWRNESIKTFGNAIVPQVAFEIFKAINKTKKLCH